MNEITLEQVEQAVGTLFKGCSSEMDSGDHDERVIQLMRYAAKQHITQTAALQEKLAAVEKERDEAKEALESKRDETVAGWMKAELADYDMVLNHCAEIYMHFSRGRISKQNTLPREVIAIAEEFDSEDINNAVKDATKEMESACAAMRQAFQAPLITSGNAKAISYYFSKGESFGGLTRDALVAWLDGVADGLDKLNASMAPTAGKDLLAKVERVKDLFGLLEKDYDHAWPAEDFATELHRMSILKLIQQTLKSL